MMVSSAALGLLLAAALQQAPETAITGTVLRFGDGGRVPLPYALVEVVEPRGARTAFADERGRYLITGVTPGPRIVRAVHIGYRTHELEVVIPRSGTLRLDLELESEPIQIPPVMVWVDPVRSLSGRDPRPVTDLAEVEFRALEITPGLVESGLSEAARSAHGSGSSDPSDALLMRGATQDLKLVLLDGAPVYAPFHMAGLIPPFEPAALGTASLYLGGAPARYNGGLSYILDLRTRRPRADRLRGSGSLDLVSADANLEGPLGSRGTFFLGSRTLHGLEPHVLDRGPSPYGYLDALGRIEVALAADWRIRSMGFWNRESVDLDLPGALTEPVQSGTPGEAEWGNRALSVILEQSRQGSSTEVGLAVSGYEARLPLSGVAPLFARGDSRRARLTGDFVRSVGSGTIRFGGSFDWLDQELTASSVVEGGAAAVESRSEATVGGAYAEGVWGVREDVRLRAGFRLDRFSSDQSVRLSPRATMTWLLTDNAALTLAAGRYHQYAATSSEAVEAALGTGLASSEVKTLLPVASASHLVLSLDQILAPGVRLGLEGFVKRFEGVGGAEDDRRLNASGLDLRVLRESTGLTGWLGYSLTWYWTPDGNGGGTSQFAGQHLLSVGLTGRLGDRWGTDLRVAFGDGLPYTSVPIGENLADQALPETTELAQPAGPDRTFFLEGGPDDAFLRVDAELFGVLRPEFGGRPLELRPYVRLLNALDRRDALFYYFEPWRGEEARPLAELSILPVVGLEWRF
jgi:hypothetical protein